MKHIPWIVGPASILKWDVFTSFIWKWYKVPLQYKERTKLEDENELSRTRNKPSMLSCLTSPENTIYIGFRFNAMTVVDLCD